MHSQRDCGKIAFKIPILTEWILDQADALCRAAGASLDAVTRQQFFFSDLREAGVAFRTMTAGFGDAMPAMSAVRVTSTAVPGCTVVADMWAVI